MFKQLVYIVLLLLPFLSFSQGKILYDVNDNNSVELKWYHANHLFFTEGCHVYRKVNGSAEWTKLATIHKKDKNSFTYNKQDSTIELFMNIADDVQALQEKDFTYLNVLVKSFESNAFADFLGIYFKDIHAEHLQQAKYRVTFMLYGEEYILGETDNIDLYNPDPEIDYQLELSQKSRMVKFKWQPNDDLYYGVDIYRRSGNQTGFTKINNNPVMIGQAEDSAGNLKVPEYFYEDRIEEKNVKYFYKIRGIGYFEDELSFSKTEEIYIKEDFLPLPPRNLERKVKNNMILLEWQNPLDTAYYHLNIYQANHSDGPFVKVNQNPIASEINSYEIPATEGLGYYLYVTSENRYGNESRSNKVFADVADKTPPAAPQNVVIEADTGKFYLSWTSNTEADLMGYQLFRKVNDEHDGEFMLMNAYPIKENYYEDNLTKNTRNEYSYFVIALDSSFNRSSYSKAVSGSLPDVTPPDPPFIKSAIPNEEGVKLTWNPSTDPDLAKYHLVRFEENDSATLISRETDKNMTEYQDQDIEGKRTYTYYLVSEDSTGNLSLSSNKVSVRTDLQNLEIAVDFTGEYNPEDQTINLSWSKPENNDFRGVIIKKRVNNYWKPISGLLVEQKFSDNKVVPGTNIYQINLVGGKGIFYHSPDLNIESLK